MMYINDFTYKREIQGRVSNKNKIFLKKNKCNL